MARVLIIDDIAVIRRMVSLALSADHEIVGELSDGYAAAAEVETVQPDVVIMDHRMPRVDGVEATRRIKALFPHVAVIGFTSEPASRDALLAAGANAAFGKSDLSELRDYLEIH